MKFTLPHLKRYRQIAKLLWKFGHSDVVRQMNQDGFDGEEEKDPREGEGKPEELADYLEEMGPTFVKIGQILAGRPDLLPEPYLQALARLQDNVKPFSYADVERIVMTELGVRISKAFAEFDREPLAAASLGQVHSAVLRDGRKVVVKVQRPDVRAQIAEDFEVLAEIAAFVDAHTAFGRRYRTTLILEEFRLTVQQELNYEREAQNLRIIGANLKEFPLLHIPQPIADYSTRSVLTMEHVSGRKITAISPLRLLDVPGGLLAEELFRAYLQQVLADGVFHADPHPGNIFLTEDGRIALLDLGMVGHTTPAMQETLIKLLLAISEGKSEESADLVITLSEKAEETDAAGLRRKISQVIAAGRDQTLAQCNVGRTLLLVIRDAAHAGYFVPSEFTLLGKTLLQLEQAGHVLDKSFDPTASIRKNVAELMTKRMAHDFSKEGLIGTALEVKKFVTGLPARLNGIMDAVANAELEVKIRAVDARMFVEGFEKIANRITTGLIVAALIIGSALLMRVETSFRIFGYPGLAILWFTAAAIGGLWLIIKSSLHDHKPRDKSARSGPPA